MEDVAHDKNETAIKCVVWDLDDTLWSGLLMEESVSLRPESLEVVRSLDRRGILQSVASRNDREAALSQLERFGLAEYLLVPQINWGPKSASIQAIANRLDIGLDTFAFVDDQPFEREEVSRAHPEVVCVDGSTPLLAILDLPRMGPRFVTADSRRRRASYREHFAREEAEENFDGTAHEYLATLDLRLTIAPADEGDLRRAEELTERTHQLNSTGYTYSYDELERLSASADHLLLVADLRDRFGDYGRIGLALVERRVDFWVMKLLIASCRVLSRGVGSALLQDVMRRARRAGAQLRAEFRDTGRNRIMNVTLRFAGFRSVDERGDLTLFAHDLAEIPPVPSYLALTSLDSPIAREAVSAPAD